MAKATVVKAPPVDPIEKVVLELTHEEAKMLRDLTGACQAGGIVESVYRALYDGGIKGFNDYAVETKHNDSWVRSGTLRLRKTS